LPQGWAIDLSRIGNDLGVGYAIEGSVQQATFSLWINARLFDAQNGVYVWVTLRSQPRRFLQTQDDAGLLFGKEGRWKVERAQKRDAPNL
jgi:TolB-like protein